MFVRAFVFVLFSGLVLNVGLNVAVAQAAVPVCFEDVRTWEQNKSKLPAFMQTEDLFAVHVSKSVKGGFQIVQQGRQFYLEAHVKHTFGRIDDSDFISQICVEDQTINVTMARGKSREIKMVEGGLELKGKVFRLTDEVEYKAVLKTIDR
ncbi:MAG: hypothetical protein V4692_16690 [Bdellovibrionota bacterium]